MWLKTLFLDLGFLLLRFSSHLGWVFLVSEVTSYLQPGKEKQ